MNGSGIVYAAAVDGQVLSFGVSGKLYKNTVLLYDRQTNSLWSQLQKEAVTGPMLGKSLKIIPSVNTTWAKWRSDHPSTLVLSDQTGFPYNYEQNPYLMYAVSPDPLFPAKHLDPRLPPKAWVVGVEVKGVFKAYPFKELEKVAIPLSDTIGDKTILIHFEPETRTATVTDDIGTALPFVTTYWFAWYDFHPDTLLFGNYQDN